MLKNVKMLSIKHFQEKQHFLKLYKKAIFDKIEIFHKKTNYGYVSQVVVLFQIYLNFVFDVFHLEHYAPDVRTWFTKSYFRNAALQGGWDLFRNNSTLW